MFADLFAADGVLAYPFPPGQPPELRGREAIRAFFAQMGQSRELFDGPALPRPVATRLGGDTLDPRHNGLI